MADLFDATRAAHYGMAGSKKSPDPFPRPERKEEKPKSRLEELHKMFSGGVLARKGG